jgi:hypothetical protein
VVKESSITRMVSSVTSPLDTGGAGRISNGRRQNWIPRGTIFTWGRTLKETVKTNRYAEELDVIEYSLLRA